jgi:hypothetical protein
VVGQEKFAISGHATCPWLRNWYSEGKKEIEGPPDYQEAGPEPTRRTGPSEGIGVSQVQTLESGQPVYRRVPFVVADIPKKTAESTGRLPPTPMLHTAAREHNVIAFGEAPPDRAKTPVMKSVRLKDNLKSTRIHDTERVLKGR